MKNYNTASHGLLCVCVMLLSGLFAAPVSGATLVGFWNLNENTGTTATDDSGSGNTGTLINAPQWIPGESGSALNFANGGKGYVSASGAESLSNLYTHGMTVAAWIKPRSAGGGNSGRIIDKDNNNGGWFFVEPRIEDALKAAGSKVTRARYAGRAGAASPATGLAKRHANEQAALVANALALSVRGEIRRRKKA